MSEDRAVSPSSSSTLMIAGGGTGGHIYPAIAVAREWVARDPSRGVVFVGTARGLETSIVPKEGFPLELLAVEGMMGKSFARKLKSAMRLPASFFGAWSLVSRWHPSAILGVGGYASGPVLLVGALRRRPTMIQEQNAFPGLTNRILARFVREVAVAFPEALERLGRGGVVTGNPVRSEFFAARARRDSNAATIRVLVFGGSQGSRLLNDSMIAALEHLVVMRDGIDIVHQTGSADHERIALAYRQAGFDTARVVPYLDPMAAELAAADLVVARAGALTIGELAASGRPAVLVPFAAATENHQEFNARAMEQAGGAIVITEREITPTLLAEVIVSLASDRDRLRVMGRAAEALGTEDATVRIVEILEDLAKER